MEDFTFVEDDIVEIGLILSSLPEVQLLLLLLLRVWVHQLLVVLQHFLFLLAGLEFLNAFETVSGLVQKGHRSFHCFVEKVRFETVLPRSPPEEDQVL